MVIKHLSIWVFFICLEQFSSYITLSKQIVGYCLSHSSVINCVKRVFCCPFLLFSQASLLLNWASCPRPAQRFHQRAQRHWCVWPAGASRQTGAWAGRWTAAAAGLRTAALGSCRRTVCTAGAAAWLSLSSSGWRASQWAVRPHAVASLPSLDNWPEISAHSRPAAAFCSSHFCFSDLIHTRDAMIFLFYLK